MRADIVPGGTFPDYELTDHTKTRRKLSELQGIDPMILVLSRGGFCPKDHQQHLELAANYPKIRRQIRPDWDLAAAGLRENWDAGDHSMHHPYQATRGQGPSAASMPTAAAVSEGA